MVTGGRREDSRFNYRSVKQFTEGQFRAVVYSMCVRSFSEILTVRTRTAGLTEMAQ